MPLAFLDGFVIVKEASLGAFNYADNNGKLVLLQLNLNEAWNGVFHQGTQQQKGGQMVYDNKYSEVSNGNCLVLCPNKNKPRKPRGSELMIQTKVICDSCGK